MYSLVHAPSALLFYALMLMRHDDRVPSQFSLSHWIVTCMHAITGHLFIFHLSLESSILFHVIYTSLVPIAYAIPHPSTPLRYRLVATSCLASTPPPTPSPSRSYLILQPRIAFPSIPYSVMPRRRSFAASMSTHATYVHTSTAVITGPLLWSRFLVVGRRCCYRARHPMDLIC